MKRFRNILVIYDAAIDGDDALGQAVAYARENAATLTIAAVLHEGQPATLVDPMPAADDHLNGKIMDLATSLASRRISTLLMMRSGGSPERFRVC